MVFRDHPRVTRARPRTAYLFLRFFYVFHVFLRLCFSCHSIPIRSRAHVSEKEMNEQTENATFQGLNLFFFRRKLSRSSTRYNELLETFTKFSYSLSRSRI